MRQKNVTATFTAVDNRPFANFTVNPNPSACNQIIGFDGTGSYHGHPSRNIVSYEWDFGDGQSASVILCRMRILHSAATSLN